MRTKWFGKTKPSAIFMRAAIRFSAYFLALSLILFGGFFFLKHQHEAGLKDQAVAAGRATIASIHRLVHRQFYEMLGDLDVVSSSLAVQRYLEMPSASALDEVNETFVNLANAYQRYDKIRLVSVEGQEMAHVELRNGAMLVRRADELESAYRLPFLARTKPEVGKTSVLPPDVSRNHGKAERPYLPVIRMVKPVEDPKGLHRAVVVLNYRAEGLLEIIRNGASEPRISSLMLVGADGRILSAPAQAGYEAWDEAYRGPFSDGTIPTSGRACSSKHRVSK